MVSSPCAHSYLQHFSAVLQAPVLHPWQDNEHLALPAHYIITTTASPQKQSHSNPQKQTHTTHPSAKLHNPLACQPYPSKILSVVFFMCYIKRKKIKQHCISLKLNLTALLRRVDPCAKEKNWKHYATYSQKNTAMEKNSGIDRTGK